MVCAHYADSRHIYFPALLPAGMLAGTGRVWPVMAMVAPVFPEPPFERVLHLALLEHLAAHAGALAVATAVC